MKVSSYWQPKGISIAQEWDSFAGVVISPKSHPMQRQAMENAFYAGAVAVMNIVLKTTDMSELDAAKMLRSCWKEIEDYAELCRKRAGA